MFELRGRLSVRGRCGHAVALTFRERVRRDEVNKRGTMHLRVDPCLASVMFVIAGVA